MREPPILPEAQLHGWLLETYGLDAVHIEFLPLGADFSAAVYRVTARDGAAYFLKLRAGEFHEIAVLTPQFLHEQGIGPVIAPIRTQRGALWAEFAGRTGLLTPFIEGTNGFATPLTDAQWVAFGAALRAIHSLTLPPDLRARLPRETFSPHWRDEVNSLMAQAETTHFTEPLAAQMAAFMRAHRDTMRQVVDRAAQLASTLQERPYEPVLCHADLHGGNLLIASDGAFYIVDWDAPLLAPKERDLMFIGAGIGRVWDREREAALFDQGYGGSEIDPAILVYYRYERIVEDFAAYGEQILRSDEGGEDRAQGLRYFTSQFEAGDVIDIARQTDRRLLQA
jgi:spectinomycin phosphotransferase